MSGSDGACLDTNQDQSAEELIHKDPVCVLSTNIIDETAGRIACVPTVPAKDNDVPDETSQILDDIFDSLESQTRHDNDVPDETPHNRIP